MVSKEQRRNGELAQRLERVKACEHAMGMAGNQVHDTAQKH